MANLNNWLIISIFEVYNKKKKNKNSLEFYIKKNLLAKEPKNKILIFLFANKKWISFF